MMILMLFNVYYNCYYILISFLICYCAITRSSVLLPKKSSNEKKY